MKKLLLIVVLLFSCRMAYAQAVISEFDEDGKVILNENIGSITRELNLIRRQTQDRVLVWYLPTVTTDTVISARLDVPFAGTIVKATAVCDTAPTGDSVIFDINLNGTSIWATNQGNRVTIADGSTALATSTTFDTADVAINDYFTLDVDQVGSTYVGDDATVQLIIRDKLHE